MSYFAELGGDDAVMRREAFVALPIATRRAVIESAAQRMAPAILGKVSDADGDLEIRGRYAVHEARARLSVATGAFTLTLRTRRALSLEGVTIGGPPQHPSRQFLADLPHNTGALLNSLLDSVPGHASTLTFSRDQLVYQLDEPTLLTLSARATERLTSVTHLFAYIAVEAEQRWPEDPNAPLTMPVIEQSFGWSEQFGPDDADLAPPVPGYGIPPR